MPLDSNIWLVKLCEVYLCTVYKKRRIQVNIIELSVENNIKVSNKTKSQNDMESLVIKTIEILYITGHANLAFGIFLWMGACKC